MIRSSSLYINCWPPLFGLESLSPPYPLLIKTLQSHEQSCRLLAVTSFPARSLDRRRASTCLLLGTTPETTAIQSHHSKRASHRRHMKPETNRQDTGLIPVSLPPFMTIPKQGRYRSNTHFKSWEACNAHAELEQHLRKTAPTSGLMAKQVAQGLDMPSALFRV